MSLQFVQGGAEIWGLGFREMEGWPPLDVLAIRQERCVHGLESRM